jgi:hypothetical protein
MKNIIALLIFFFCSEVLMSQSSPPGIPYQAVMRNADGTVAANSAVSVRFTLHQNTTDGNIEYQEVHTVTTNAQGLIALVIGQGVSQQNSFSTIDWSSTIKFLQVEVDLGSGYVDLGTQQLMSVPFAKFAENGIPGKSSLVKTTTESSGSNCSNGGLKVQTGIDLNENFSLDDSEINDNYTHYVCNGLNASSAYSAPVNNLQGNYSVYSGSQVPNFLRYFGDCSGGNKVCTENELLVSNSKFCNLTIPAGVTARINPAERTLIYVQDTLFLYGSINGSGGLNLTNVSNQTTNHVGAGASSFNVCNCSSGSCASIGSGNSNFSISWTAAQTPSTLYGYFDGSIAKTSGTGLCDVSCNTWMGNMVNGSDLTVDDLQTLMHFGSNIAGSNGQSVYAGFNSCQVTSNGGQGGAGLYIMARNIVFDGLISLNGGNGVIGTSACGSPSTSASAGAGAGSCIISTVNIISQNGVFQANGGLAGLSNCGIRGGNGSMIIVSE